MMFWLYVLARPQPASRWATAQCGANCGGLQEKCDGCVAGCASCSATWQPVLSHAPRCPGCPGGCAGCAGTQQHAPRCPGCPGGCAGCAGTQQVRALFA